jgi:hypothetical protein
MKRLDEYNIPKWLACEAIPSEKKKEFWKSNTFRFLTATQVGPWALSSSERADGAKKRAFKELIDLSLGIKPKERFQSFAMARGIESESMAESDFEEFLGEELIKVGLCKDRSRLLVCIPDGLLSTSSAGFEGKAPSEFKHNGYLFAGTLPTQYLYQVHFCMAVTGADGWWFQSWHPLADSFRILVERNKFTESLNNKLDELSCELEEAMKKAHEKY